MEVEWPSSANLQQCRHSLSMAADRLGQLRSCAWLVLFGRPGWAEATCRASEGIHGAQDHWRKTAAD